MNAGPTRDANVLQADIAVFKLELLDCDVLFSPQIIEHLRFESDRLLRVAGRIRGV